MKFFVILIIALLIFNSFAYANEEAYVFVTDERDNPIKGYKILPTEKKDIFICTIEPLKKWIITPKSLLIIVKDRDIYRVKDSIVFDRKNGIALLKADLTNVITLSFKINEIEIDKNISVLIKNKKLISAKLDELFPYEEKVSTLPSKEEEANLLNLAEYYESLGQFDKALNLYEKILSQAPNDKVIMEKIALINYRLGNFKKAKEYFFKLSSDEKSLARIVGILIIEKDFENALKILNNYEKHQSKYFHYIKGVILYLTGKKDEAYKELLVLIKIDKNLARNLHELLR